MAQAVPVGGIIVAKIGSSTLVDESGRIDTVFVHALCDQIAELVSVGVHVVLVSPVLWQRALRGLVLAIDPQI